MGAIQDISQQIAPAPVEDEGGGGSGFGDGAAADEAGANPSGVQGQSTDGTDSEEQQITTGNSQPSSEPEQQGSSTQTSQTPQTSQGTETSETGGGFFQELAEAAEGLAETSTSSTSQPQTSTPTQTTSTSSSAQTSDDFWASLTAQIDSATTPEQLQAPLQQATAMLPAVKPQEAFQQTQEEAQARDAEQAKAEQQAKLRQQQMQASLRDVVRAGRTKAQQLAQAAQKARDPNALKLAREYGSQFAQLQKKLAEMETQRMQEISESFRKEYDFLMNKGQRPSTFTQVVAKGASAEEGEDVTQKDLAEADEMAHTVDSEDTSYEDVKKPEPSWRKTPDKDSLTAKKKEVDAELAHQKTTTQDPTKKPPTAADLLQTTALLAASTGPYKLTPEQAAERKALYSCPEGRAATTALQGGAVVHNTKGGFIRRVLGLVHRNEKNEDEPENRTPSVEEGATLTVGALHAVVGGSPVVPAEERFIASSPRPVPTTNWKGSVLSLRDLVYRTSGSFVPTPRREDYFGSTFNRKAYNDALAMGAEVSVSMLRFCRPSSEGLVELHVG